jgi:hypothetical protein
MGVRLVILFVVGFAAAAPAIATAQPTGEVGGPPTMAHLPFPPPQNKKLFIRARSEAIVIGVGIDSFGRVEIVGQDSDSGLCISVDHPKQGVSSSGCGSIALPRVIAADTFNWRTRRHQHKSLAEVSGLMQPTVATVTAVAHRRKGHRRTSKAVSATVAVPGPDLLARLHQATPFGFFVAGFRGCLGNSKVRFRGFAATGFLLGTFRVNLGFPGRFNDAFQPCEPGSGFAFFGKIPGVPVPTPLY